MTTTKRKLTDDLAAMAVRLTKAERILRRMLDPEQLGWAVTAEVRGEVREYFREHEGQR